MSRTGLTICARPVSIPTRWVMNHPEVSVVLSGMTTMEQVEDNINTAQDGKANSLTEKEIRLMDFAKNTFKEKMKINCTGCRYCMPCPHGVDIPNNFSVYNNAYLFDSLEFSKAQYGMNFSKEAKASNCIQCGRCEKHCPQNIAIREGLKNVRSAFE